MAEEKKGTPIEKWDEVNGRDGTGVTAISDSSKSMGERFVELRESTGMNRKDFAEYLNIPYRTMTDWELNKHIMPEYVLALIEYKVEHEMCRNEKGQDVQMHGIEDLLEQNDNQIDGVINNVFTESKAEKGTKASVIEKLKNAEQEKHSVRCAYPTDREAR